MVRPAAGPPGSVTVQGLLLSLLLLLLLGALLIAHRLLGTLHRLRVGVAELLLDLRLTLLVGELLGLHGLLVTLCSRALPWWRNLRARRAGRQQQGTGQSDA